jgi:hypothetical protein
LLTVSEVSVHDGFGPVITQYIMVGAFGEETVHLTVARKREKGMKDAEVPISPSRSYCL